MIVCQDCSRAEISQYLDSVFEDSAPYGDKTPAIVRGGCAVGVEGE